MKQMLKIEIERAFGGIAFYVALLIGFAISLVQFLNVGVRAALNPLHFYEFNGLLFPENVSYVWMGAVSDVYYNVFIRIIPILVVMPYAVSYYSDRRHGIIDNYYIRTKKINYLMAKLTAVFLSGGVITIFPLVINLISTSAILPTLMWPTATNEVRSGAMMSSLYYSHVSIYNILYFILLFICGGLLATIPLMVSLWLNNTFVVLMFPTVLCEFINVAAGWSSSYVIKGVRPERLFNMAQITPNNIWSYIVFIVSIVLLDMVMYVWRGVKHDAL